MWPVAVHKLNNVACTVVDKFNKPQLVCVSHIVVHTFLAAIKFLHFRAAGDAAGRQRVGVYICPLAN